MKHGCHWLLGALAWCGACTPQPEAPRIGAIAQQVRAGASDSGEIFLGADLLVTEASGGSLPCGTGNVTFDVAVSRNGAEGPYQAIEQARVYRACSNISQGQLALVLDNSKSLEGELDQLKSGARRVSEAVIAAGGLVSLTRVSTNAQILSELTDDQAQMDQAIDSMYISNGWTALYDGIRQGGETLGRLAQASAPTVFDDARSFCNLDTHRGIIAFTDSGENNSSRQRLYSEDYPGDAIDTAFEDLTHLNVGATTTPLYTVGLGRNADHAALAELAQASGGRHLSLDDPDAIENVLGMLAEYTGSTERICTKLPDHLCGSLDVRIGYHYDQDGNTVSGESTHHLELPCAARAEGRVATVLLTLEATDMGTETVGRLIAQTVNWASPVDAPRVLFVRDDFHHDEFGHDTQKLYETLAQAGYAAQFRDEPAEGLTLGDFEGFDVVWFSNPGYPMDDLSSFNALLRFSQAGGGVVLQGDDMSWSYGMAFAMDPLTHAHHVDNGTYYCGHGIDNGSGSYQVSFADSEHPILAGLAGQTFRYTDDIDTTTVVQGPSGSSTEVLAWANVPGVQGCATKPVVIAYTPPSAP